MTEALAAANDVENSSSPIPLHLTLITNSVEPDPRSGEHLVGAGQPHLQLVGAEIKPNKWAAEVHTLEMALMLFGQQVHPYYAAQFREFMENYGFPLFRYARGMNTPHRNLETPISIFRLYMNGFSHKDIKMTLADTTTTGYSRTKRNVIDTLDSRVPITHLRNGFVEYCEAGRSPMLDEVIKHFSDKMMGKTTLSLVMSQSGTDRRRIGRPPIFLAMGVEAPTTLSDSHEADWRVQARCRGSYVNFFYPRTGGLATVAKQLCGGCSVKAQCLAYATEIGDQHAVMGGMTAEQRGYG